ncbi:hypothetical protein CCACVL1_29405 [Corchorus capsularis]|uniref:Uncharacterized protein n=1 Tax=Corchorus capsularis TaxID=210143 RepID=A0A1R3G1T6_COCAP|nr:hypothetical protein CCACVL1_29405 [Corchorus capsularis]
MAEDQVLHGTKKNVYNLWIELTEGESKISDTTPPICTVKEEPRLAKT